MLGVAISGKMGWGWNLTRAKGNLLWLVHLSTHSTLSREVGALSFQNWAHIWDWWAHYLRCLHFQHRTLPRHVLLLDVPTSFYFLWYLRSQRNSGNAGSNIMLVQTEHRCVNSNQKDEQSGTEEESFPRFEYRATYWWQWGHQCFQLPQGEFVSFLYVLSEEQKRTRQWGLQ